MDSNSSQTGSQETYANDSDSACENSVFVVSPKADNDPAFPPPDEDSVMEAQDDKGKWRRRSLKLLVAFKVFAVYILIFAILSPVILGYVFHLQVASFFSITLGIYGIFTIAHFGIQAVTAIIFHTIVRKAYNARSEDPEKSMLSPLKTAIVAAVYKEDPPVFKNGLRSLRDMDLTNNRLIVIVCDGNDVDDEPMIEAFIQIFPKHSTVVALDSLVEGRKTLAPFSDDIRYVMIVQPHGGKREAIYSAFVLCTQYKELDAIMTTDSDTILDRMALQELSIELNSDPCVGACVGEVLV